MKTHFLTPIRIGKDAILYTTLCTRESSNLNGESNIEKVDCKLCKHYYQNEKSWQWRGYT